MVVPGTRWKNKNSEALALANPMSKIVSKLRSSLVQSKACGLLLCRAVECAGYYVVLLEVELEQGNLLSQACFGCSIVTTDVDKQQYELSLEEAFYLYHSLNCLEVVWEDKRLQSSDELWKLMISKWKEFPIFYKAYSHLRAKNWTVRSEIKYGVDYVAYHHHPSLVHSEYAVMVSAGNGDVNTRLTSWPSLHAVVRLEDGVAKTLLVLHIKKNVDIDLSSSLEHYTVEEQTIARWNLEQCLEGLTIVSDGTEKSCDIGLHTQCSPHHNFNKFSLHQNVTLPSLSPSSMVVASTTRWKGKCSQVVALTNPLSELITQLQSSLLQSKASGLFVGSAVLLEVGIEQTDLLNRACFGCYIVMTNDDSHWFELSLEEAFYLCHSLNCIKIVRNDQSPNDNTELWGVMKSTRETFPIFCKAYCHLRAKNWVVRSGIQYGVDFVAYRHHPSLVHSEYAVIVSEGNSATKARLLVWQDVHATVRLEGGVAKTLLVLHIMKNGYDTVSSSCLKHYTVEEQLVTRWNPEECRESKKT